MSTLYMMKSATDTICESFILVSGGVVTVIDGGFESEAETLYAKLRELGGHVDAWFFTHPHDDHYGAFCRLLEQVCGKRIIYYIDNTAAFREVSQINELVAIVRISSHRCSVDDDFHIFMLMKVSVGDAAFLAASCSNEDF